ncbi:MAG: CBS domain-containing protein [Candidatus Bilamarchaeum sp.]|jgi:ribosomal subunit interface protein
MEIKKTLIVESDEPLSKATAHLDESGAVIVTKNGKYYGVINRESVAHGYSSFGAVKCENCAVKPPTLDKSATVAEQMGAFLSGHYRAIPVLDEQERPLGVATRVDLLRELQSMRMTPKGSISEMMNSPVHTILETQPLSKAKSTMKEKKARRLVVLNDKGFVSGVISEFDIDLWLAAGNLQGGKKDKEDIVKIETMRISEFLKADLSQVEENTTVDEAVNKMIKNGTSEVVVISSKKPVGVLSSLDIFKSIKEGSKPKNPVIVSGLNNDSTSQHEHINEKFGHLIEKFGKSIEINSLNVHVKEGKSAFTINVNVETDDGKITIKHERQSLNEAIDEVAKELDTILRKKKEMRKAKPRTIGAGGDE